VGPLLDPFFSLGVFVAIVKRLAKVEGLKIAMVQQTIKAGMAFSLREPVSVLLQLWESEDTSPGGRWGRDRSPNFRGMCG
jgi:hypothetical protein